MRLSITHHHLCAAVNTEITKAGKGGVIRILDMGCGDGAMLSFLCHKLPQLRKDVSVEVYGLDVSDSRVQASNYLAVTIQRLKEALPETDWHRRIALITSNDEWPYADGFFDFVISNQVLEHVHDHDTALGQMRRVLKSDGVSIHLFPLKNYLYEDHLHLPFVHWISNDELLVAYLRRCSRLGLGKFRIHQKTAGDSLDLKEWVRRHADYLTYEINYLKLAEIYALAKRQRLRCSFRYTGGFYFNKLRLVLGLPLRYEYSLRRWPFIERLALSLYMRISSITLVLEREHTY